MPELRYHRRVYGRYRLVLPVRVQSPDYEALGETTDVSCGGVGVMLKPGYTLFDNTTTRHLWIEDIGFFDVSVRWQTGNRLGLQFLHSNNAAPRIDQYFQENNIETKGDLIEEPLSEAVNR